MRDRRRNKYAFQRLRLLVLAEADHRCARCGAPADQVDHIVPLIEWPEGELVRSNLQALCKRCNVQKEHVRRAEAAAVDLRYGPRRAW